MGLKTHARNTNNLNKAIAIYCRMLYPNGSPE
jgi:hypothetical protein